jgi:hypothetical protein
MVWATASFKHLLGADAEVEVQRSSLFACHNFSGNRLFGALVTLACFNHLEQQPFPTSLYDKTTEIGWR